MTPEIGVVLPAYNAQTFLGEALESILAQTLTGWEAIVVDDGSRDRTAEIGQDYHARDARIRVHSQPNGGVCSARNTGYHLLSPTVRYVLFLDADDLLEPDALQVLVDALQAHPDWVAAYGLAQLFEGEITWTATLEQAHGFERWGYRDGHYVAWPADQPTSFEVLAVWPAIGTGGQILYRREALADLPFDERLRMSEDWDFWLRLAARSRIGYLPTFVMRKRCHEDNAGASSIARGGERIVREKWRSMPEWTPEQRSLLPVAHRRAALLRLDWALSALRQHDLRAAAQHARRFLLAYLDYVRVQHAL